MIVKPTLQLRIDEPAPRGPAPRAAAIPFRGDGFAQGQVADDRDRW